MRGIVCQSEKQFNFRADLLEPELLDGHAIVSVKRIGICGTDYHAYNGNQPFFQFPKILGHELSGVIHSVGENEYSLSIGDRVAIIPYLHCGSCIACRQNKTNCCKNMEVLGVHTDGGMREKISIPLTHLIKVDDLSLDAAAMLEPLAIGAHAVKRAQIKSKDTVLVIGSGPIGLGVMAFAKNEGARVIALDINDERLDFCKTWAGVDETINGNEVDVPQRLADLTDGDFPVTVFDATGNVKSMSNAFSYVAHGGTLVYVGLVKQDITFDDPEFHKRELTLMGSRNATTIDFQYVLKVLSTQFIDIDKYITHRTTLDNMINVFETWMKPESKVIKGIVEV